MNIIHDLNGLTYILALSFLGLWFLFSARKTWNVLMGLAFFICLLSNFLITIGATVGPAKYFIFSKNLILIGFFGFVFRLFRNNKIGLVLAITISIIASSHIFQLNIGEKLIPKKVKESIEQGELIIETTSDHIESIQSLLRKYKGQMDKAFSPVQKGTALDNFYLIDIPNDLSDKKNELLKELEEKALIQYGEFNDVVEVAPLEVERKEKHETMLSVNDPMVTGQWALSALQMGDWYQQLIDHRYKFVNTVKVAVLDTGVDGAHEDLHQLLDKDDRSEKDPVGHGTHCAGIVAAETNNRTGIASPAFYNDIIQIMPIRVLNRLGFGTQAQIIKGMIRAVDEGAAVLSMSLGGISDTPKQKAYKAAVEYAHAKNAVVVTSAGNSSSNAKGYTPANVPGVICVTALNEQGDLAGFSNYINDIDQGIAAPGVNILSTYPGNGYKALSGTSMATPFVSSTVAVIKAFAPELTPQEIYHILHQTSLPTRDVDKSGRLLQPAAALEFVLDQL